MELVGLPTGKTIKEELLLFLAIIYMYLCIYLLYVHEYFCQRILKKVDILGWNTIMFLYPMQRVAEGIIFLTCPSVSQSVSQSVLFFLLVQLL